MRAVGVVVPLIFAAVKDNSGAMDRNERQQLRAVSDEVAGWVASAEAWLAFQASTKGAAGQAGSAIAARAVTVRTDARAGWRIIALAATDGPALGALARQTQLPPLPDATSRTLNGLVTQCAAAVRDARTVLGARRFFAGRQHRETGAAAAEYLAGYRQWGHSTDVPGLLAWLTRWSAAQNPHVDTKDALADWVGLQRLIVPPGHQAELVSAEAVRGLVWASDRIDHGLRGEQALRAQAVAAGEAVRTAEVNKMVSQMPVERLKDATRDRLRIGPLTDVGIKTVMQVLQAGNRLEGLPGVGPITAQRMWAAARTLWQTTHDEMPVRIDIKARTPETKQLLLQLQAWDSVRQLRRATTDLALKDALAPLTSRLNSETKHLIIVGSDQPAPELFTAVSAVIRRGQLVHTANPREARADPWDDFLARPADYFAMLAELGFISEDQAKTHGDLPDEIVQAVRELQLNTEHLVASLRGYQSFGARFALVQRRVIIGDEMGLGKTVEALAVLAHLRSKGFHHSLVICPAAVVTNWTREVRSKSLLAAYRLHGLGRDAEVRSWLRNGGVAVTTYETLPWLRPHLYDLHDLGCVIVDEAHYIKNPDAQRSNRVRWVLQRSERAILLTGTPLENRIDEFRNLVRYVRPDLAVDGSDLAPRRFRRQVAPAYLRRNQEDVLTELPELVEVDEWLPLSDRDAVLYRSAVAEGNFMAMRQAAMLGGPQSEKVQRLLEIVEEARDNERRVLVFSHFRAVLDEVARVLHGPVYGPLTGSVAPAVRQVMVDQFSAAQHGAVLVSQIVAGGQGLNIQAASVVVICEPQLKPTTEWQAIARARRMGQLQSVQVHRLLSEEGVDQRITEILERKKELFDDFARVSETAISAPEAFDISEAELAREVVAAERERLFARAKGRMGP